MRVEKDSVRQILAVAMCAEWLLLILLAQPSSLPSL